MTRKEARELIRALDTAMYETEAEMDLRDVPDELIEAMGKAREIAVKYAERENLSISFGDEAAASFSDRIDNMTDYYVRITTRDGAEIEGVIVGSGLNVEVDGNTWYDAVTYLPADEESGLAIEGAPEQTVRVSDVYVY